MRKKNNNSVGKNGNRGKNKASVRKNGRTTSKNGNQRHRTYSGVVKNPKTKEVTGRVYFSENNGLNGPNYGTLVIIAALSALAATVSPIGNAIVSQFGFSGIAAAGMWWTLVAIAAVVGSILYILDWSTKGKF